MVLEEDKIVKLVRRHLDAVIEESRIEKHRMAMEFNGRRYESPEWLNSKRLRAPARGYYAENTQLD